MGEKKVVDWTALVAWCDSNDIPKSTRGNLYTIMAKADAQHERIVAGLEADAACWRRYLAFGGSSDSSQSHACRRCGHTYTPLPSECEDCPVCGHDGSDAFLAQTEEGVK